MEAIEIHDLTEAGIVAVQFQDLLPHLEHQAPHLELYLIEFDVVLKDSSPYHLADLRAKIEQSEAGLQISWGELKELAAAIVDIQDLTLAGCLPPKTPIRSSAFQSLCTSCNLVVECFDSSFWRICSDDPECIRAIREQFFVVRNFSLSGDDTGAPGS